MQARTCHAYIVKTTLYPHWLCFMLKYHGNNILFIWSWCCCLCHLCIWLIVLFLNHYYIFWCLQYQYILNNILYMSYNTPYHTFIISRTSHITHFPYHIFTILHIYHITHLPYHIFIIPHKYVTMPPIYYTIHLPCHTSILLL